MLAQQPSKAPRISSRTPWSIGRGVFVCLLGGLVALPGTVAASASQCTTHDLSPQLPLASVRVERVIDGDTLRLHDGRRVRLIGINTPELPPNQPPQPMAAAARAQLRTMVEGRTVTMARGLEAEDNHGRVLAHLFLEDGASVEGALVRRGLGWHVAIPPNLALAECLAAREEEAMAEAGGVWALPPTAVSEVTRGGFHYLRGKVTRVSFGRSWWLSLEGRLAARIGPRDQHFFQRAAISALEGKHVELRGWVYPSRSEKYEPWRINLQTPYGMEVVE